MNALPVVKRRTSRMTAALLAVRICMGRRTAVPGWMRRLSLSLCPADEDRKRTNIDDSMKVRYIGEKYLGTAFERGKIYEVLSVEKG